VIRFLLLVAIAGALAFCGATVPLGKRTFFGHVRAIWATDEVRELEQGVKESAKPALDRVKRGVEAGYQAMQADDAGAAAGSGSAAGSGVGSNAP
jgi:hypothetical protein